MGHVVLVFHSIRIGFANIASKPYVIWLQENRFPKGWLRRLFVVASKLIRIGA